MRTIELGERQNAATFGFTTDGRAVAVASEFSNNEGKTISRVQQWDLGTGKSMLARPVDLPVYDSTGGTEWRVAGIAGSGRHFVTVSPGVVGSRGVAWARVTRMRVWALPGQQLAEFRFRPESPAPPWLMGALLHASRNVATEPDGALRVELPAASIRARATTAGAILEHVAAAAALLAPPGAVDDVFVPAISADGRWSAVVPPDHRTIRVWSTVTRLPSSQHVLEPKPLLAAGFLADDGVVVYIQGDGSARVAYTGSRRGRKPEWIAAMAVALTGARLSGSGYSLEWLTESELTTQRQSLLQMLRTASHDDRGSTNCAGGGEPAGPDQLALCGHNGRRRRLTFGRFPDLAERRLGRAKSRPPR
jgi:hypothetical protein